MPSRRVDSRRVLVAGLSLDRQFGLDERRGGSGDGRVVAGRRRRVAARGRGQRRGWVGCVCAGEHRRLAAVRVAESSAGRRGRVQRRGGRDRRWNSRLADGGRLNMRVCGGNAGVRSKDWIVAQALALRLFAVVAGRMRLVALGRGQDVNKRWSTSKVGAVGGSRKGA